jgi:DNA-binding SARP family transcriptional activator
MDRSDLIRVLGPVDVVLGGEATAVGSHHGRALLAALVVAAGHAVSVRQLEAAVWGDDPPRSSDDSLHTYVSRLRHLLGRDTIERSDHAYRLVVGRGQIDALRFEDLLAQAAEHRADPETCLRLSRGALALWRGEPFGDLADHDAFRLEAMRLDELRVTAMELALESELALGRSGIVVAELDSAVEEYPYRERLWYLLIRALHREDRRVEALRACQRLRAVLAEAGLGPGDELRMLEAEVLRNGSAPGREPASPERGSPVGPVGPVEATAGNHAT